MLKNVVAICGMNGHQIHEALLNHPLAEIGGLYDCMVLNSDSRFDSFKRYDNYDAVLNDADINLVSLCSAYRSEQAEQAVLAMKAGKNVYAEKPCAMTVSDFNMLVLTVKETGMYFREMSNGIAEALPFLLIKETVESGILGDIIQIFAQKSYPNHTDRPQNENVDGGQLLQNAAYTLRMAEQVVGLKVIEITAYQTHKGNLKNSGLVTAVSIAARLENGALMSALSNYCNQRTFGIWGNETLRVFGTKGFAEVVDGGRMSRLVTKDQDYGEIVLKGKERNYLDDYLAFLLNKGLMKRSMEEELHPTKMAIIAREESK